MDDKRLLEGVRVVELSTYVAAPFCGAMLSDLGAEVIKVEPPAGDPHRTYMKKDPDGNILFDAVNSEKKSVTVNMQSADGIKALKKLISTADVFITNTREKSLVKRGLDHETLCGEFPGLIYGWVSGFGEEGPEADMPAYDSSAYYAKSGLLLDMMQLTDTSYPCINPVAGGDRVASLGLFSLIMAALLRKEKTGKGDYVTISLFQMGLFQNSHNIISQQFGFIKPLRRGKVAPECTVYKCADGKWLMLAVMNYPKQGRRLWKVLGQEDMFGKPEYAYPKEYIPRFSEIVDSFEKIFITRSSDEWYELLKAEDISCCILADSDTVQESAQAWANGYFEKHAVGNSREYVVPRSIIQLASQPEPYLHGAPQTIGQDNAAVFGELGMTEEEIARAVR